jgi:peptidoglycan/LPS O-acetylase OafA/YrhL
LRWTGRISYGLYLWHWLVICYYVHYHPSSVAHPALFQIPMLCISYALATLSYEVVEKRFLRRGEPQHNTASTPWSFEWRAAVRRFAKSYRERASTPRSGYQALVARTRGRLHRARPVAGPYFMRRNKHAAVHVEKSGT